jgi:hypothetical protein
MKHAPHGRTARSFLLSAALLLVAFAAAPSVHAQAGGGRNMDPAARAQQQVEAISQKVQLTPQQSEQIKAILLKEYTDSRALRDKAQASGADRASLRPQMQALRDDADKKIDALLTAAQKPAYKAYVDEQNARRGQGGQRGQGGGGGR